MSQSDLPPDNAPDNAPDDTPDDAPATAADAAPDTGSETATDAGSDPGPTLTRLQDFLKLLGLVRSGGEAKLWIQDGHVLVNGEVETRRRRQLRAPDRVSIRDIDGIEDDESWRVGEELGEEPDQLPDEVPGAGS